MKRITLSLISFLVIGTTSFAQTAQATKAQPFVQIGVSAGVDRVINENVEIGVGNKLNRVSVIGQSFDSNPSTDRKYLAGIKYLRLLPVLPNLSATLSVAAKTRVDNTALYVVEPGAGFNVDFGRGVNFTTGVSSPITQVSYTKRQTNLAGNVGLLFKL